MKLIDVITEGSITEANVAQKILKDPRMTKLLTIAWKHDSTLPPTVVARLGPSPTEQQVVNAWSKLIDDTLRRNEYGDLSADGKFDEWLTRLYINGQADYEDINGEGGDALGAWKALSIRGLLKPRDQDFNKFTSIKKLQRIRNDRDYKDDLERIKNHEKIESMKREAVQIEIYDDERFNAIVPMNYGACYTRDKSKGFIPTFCTSSSGGPDWFQRYAPQGIIINIVDKENLNDKNGKWQIHAPSNQFKNAAQDYDGGDENFAKRFPGLLKKVLNGLQRHADEVQEASKIIVPGTGYNIEKEIDLIKNKFPHSYNSKSDEPEPEQAPEQLNDGPGTYLVTQIATGRTARIPADSLAHAQEQLLARHPTFDLNDYTFELIPNEQ